jgi:hypothetical protein
MRVEEVTFIGQFDRNDYPYVTSCREFLTYPGPEVGVRFARVGCAFRRVTRAYVRGRDR